MRSKIFIPGSWKKNIVASRYEKEAGCEILSKSIKLKYKSVLKIIWLNYILTFIVDIWSDTRLTTLINLLNHMHKTCI